MQVHALPTGGEHERTSPVLPHAVDAGADEPSSPSPPLSSSPFRLSPRTALDLTSSSSSSSSSSSTTSSLVSIPRGKAPPSQQATGGVVTIGSPDTATFRRVTNVAEECKYREERRLRDLALRRLQSPLRLLLSSTSPSSSPRMMTDNFVEYRSRKYVERVRQRKEEEQRQMEEWEKSYNDLRVVGGSYSSDEAARQDDAEARGEDNKAKEQDGDDEECSDEFDRDGGSVDSNEDGEDDDGDDDDERPALTVRDLLNERKKKKRMKERQARKDAKEGRQGDEDMTIKDLLEKRRSEKRARDQKPSTVAGDAFAALKLPSMDEEAEEWEWRDGISESKRKSSSGESQSKSSSTDDQVIKVSGLAQLFGKRRKKRSGGGRGGSGKGELVISEPEQDSFKRLTNPIETRNVILHRLSEERKIQTETSSRIRMILDVVVIEAWDLQSVDSRLVLPYCTLKLEGTTQIAETTKESINVEMWNQDFTFLYYESPAATNRLVVSVSNAAKSKNRSTPIGCVSIDLSQFQDGQLWDLWLDLRNPELPSAWLWDRQLDEAPLLQTNSTTAGYGFIHLKVHKNSKKDLGLLSFYGQPLSAVPLRVDVGDIVLFSDEKELAKQCIHIATSSKWDHMGMVVRMRGINGLLLLESTMNGVDVYNLNERLDFYRETCALGIRRLQLHRTTVMTEAILDFVDEVVGKPYNMNFVQLVKGKWGKNQEDNVSSYFCSQLVAAAYQRMDLLSSSIPSTNYLPAHFEGGRKRVQLLNGARLSEVYIVPSKISS